MKCFFSLLSQSNPHALLSYEISSFNMLLMFYTYWQSCLLNTRIVNCVIPNHIIISIYTDLIGTAAKHYQYQQQQLKHGKYSKCFLSWRSHSPLTCSPFYATEFRAAWTEKYKTRLNLQLILYCATSQSPALLQSQAASCTKYLCATPLRVKIYSGLTQSPLDRKSVV